MDEGRCRLICGDEGVGGKLGSPSRGETLGNGFTIWSTVQWLQNSELHTFTVQQCR